MDLFETAPEVSGIADHAINIALEIMDHCVIDMAKQTIINTIENCSLDDIKYLFAGQSGTQNEIQLHLS